MSAAIQPMQIKATRTQQQAPVSFYLFLRLMRQREPSSELFNRNNSHKNSSGQVLRKKYPMKGSSIFKLKPFVKEINHSDLSDDAKHQKILPA